MSAFTPSLLPTKAAIEAERERRYAVALRIHIERIADPRWPAWPEEADAEYHRWVRAHWSIAASDEFDLHLDEFSGLFPVELHELCFQLLDCRQDADHVRELLRSGGFPLWPEDWSGPWWEYYKTLPPASSKARAREEEFRRAMWRVARTLTWRPECVEQERRSERERYERHWSRPHEELLAELRENRICGIRGRYRLQGTEWERKRGITRADIDAP